MTLRSWLSGIRSRITLKSRATRRSPQPQRTASAAEMLEIRQVPTTAVLQLGVLTITGSDQADNIAVTKSGSNLRVSGVATTFAASKVTSVVVNAGGGDDTVDLGAVTVSTQVFGGAGNDVLIGGSGKDSLKGETGNDVLRGNGGNDVLDGGADRDSIRESANANFVLTNVLLTGVGTDTLVSIETASLQGGAGNNRLDAAQFSGSVTLDGAAGNDALVGGSANDSLIGGIGSDKLIGNGGSDVLEGGAGNDVLTGSDGDDRFVFSGSVSLGSDTITVGDNLGTNTLDLSGFEFAITGLNLGVTTPQTVNGSFLKLTLGSNDAIDNVFGTAFNDTITGNGLANTLDGRDGNDTLIGNGGDDVLEGGADNTVTQPPAAPPSVIVPKLPVAVRAPGIRSTSLANNALPAVDFVPVTNRIGSGWINGFDETTVGDFDGDGRDDILFREIDSGENRIAFARGNEDFSIVLNRIPQGWINGYDKVVAGDFNGDGRDDLFFREIDSGANRIVFAAPGHNEEFWVATNLIAPSHVNGYDRMVAGDFDGNGSDDLFFLVRASGANRIAYSVGGLQFSIATERIGASAVNNYDEVVAGDFDGDRRADLFFRQTVSGANRFAFSRGDGFTIVSDRLGRGAINGFDQVVVGDINGDNYDDLFFRAIKSGTNRLAIARPGGHEDFYIATQSIASGHINGFDEAFLGDFDGDRRHDLLLREVDSGVNRIGFVRGSAAQFVELDNTMQYRLNPDGPPLPQQSRPR